MDLTTMLRHGLGRAVLFLRNETDPVPHRVIIRQACLEDWRHDRQTEEERSPYLFDVIHATREPGYYVGFIHDSLNAIATSAEPENTCRSQLISLAALLTKHGDGDLRGALYESVRRIAAEPGGDDIFADVGYAIIEMDGIVGYQFLAEHRLRIADGDEEQWEEIFLLNELYEQLGDQAASDALNALTGDAPHLSPYIAAVRRVRDENERSAKADRERDEVARKVAPTGEAIRSYLDGTQTVKPRTRHIDAAMRERLAQELSVEPDPERQLRYVRLLRSPEHLPFPGDPEIMLRLIRQTENESLAWFAALALEYTSHPPLRAAALRFLQTEDRLIHGIRLLPFNPGAEDIALLTRLLARDWEEDHFHSFGISVLHYVERHTDPELIPILLRCYEMMVCGVCRRAIVRELLKRDALPPTLRAECRYDANPDTRDLVRAVPDF